jgi:hypothetical protein
MVPASVAVQGIGYGPLAVATQGFFSGVVYQVNADFTVTCAVDVALANVYGEAQEFPITCDLGVQTEVIYGGGPGPYHDHWIRRFFTLLGRKRT